MMFRVSVVVVSAGVAVGVLVLRQRRRRVRRATIEINVDATRLLVADVNPVLSVLVREVHSREVAMGNGSIEVVVRSLANEARDVGAAQEAVVVRSAVSARVEGKRWSVAEEVRAMSAVAAARGATGVVVGCLRTLRPRPAKGALWKVAAVKKGEPPFVADGDHVDDLPRWLLGAGTATVVGDEIALARCLDALHGDVVVARADLERKLTSVVARRHAVATDAASQIDLLLKLATKADLSHFTYIRSFGLCVGALVSNDLFKADLFKTDLSS